MPSVPVFPALLAGAVAALYVLAPGYFTTGAARVASTGYPLDAPGADAWGALQHAPYPPYPFGGHPLLARLVPVSFYEASLRPLPPLLFSAVYYIVAHAANRSLGPAPKDATRGPALTARLLRAAVVAHNLALALYSAFTFAAMLPPVVDLFAQGWRGNGIEGMKVALCSIPTNDPYLGRWAYLFMLSKYYEVVDSLILHLKGKRIGHLQSYHHAGALICMWVAYRYQSQPVWVFVTFNSGVHTAMYLYYVCAALHLPFPRALKRNLTTLQILQIASGTLLTNLYLLISLSPAHVLSTLSTVHTSLPRRFASHTDTLFFSGGPPHKAMELATYAADRATSSVPASCLQTKGAEVALHVNTAYMLPLLGLFAHFFISSYLRPSKTARTKGAVDAPPAPAPSAATRAGQSAGQPRPAVPAYVAPPSGRPGERSLKAVPASNRP